MLATQVLQGGRPYLDAAAATQVSEPFVEDDATGPEFSAVPELAALENAPKGAASDAAEDPFLALQDGAAATPDEAQDDMLRDIYMRETTAHVATVRDYLRREQQRPQPHELTEEVYRACHTLSGSSTMAEARHGIRLAQAA